MGQFMSYSGEVLGVEGGHFYWKKLLTYFFLWEGFPMPLPHDRPVPSVQQYAILASEALGPCRRTLTHGHLAVVHVQESYGSLLGSGISGL